MYFPFVWQGKIQIIFPAWRIRKTSEERSVFSIYSPLVKFYYNTAFYEDSGDCFVNHTVTYKTRNIRSFLLAEVMSAVACVSPPLGCFINDSMSACRCTYMWVVPYCRSVCAAGGHGSLAAGGAAEECAWQAGPESEGCVRAGDGEEKHPQCHEIQRARERWARPLKLRLSVSIWKSVNRLLLWSAEESIKAFHQIKTHS